MLIGSLQYPNNIITNIFFITNKCYTEQTNAKCDCILGTCKGKHFEYAIISFESVIDRRAFCATEELATYCVQ